MLTERNNSTLLSRYEVILLRKFLFFLVKLEQKPCLPDPFVPCYMTLSKLASLLSLKDIKPLYLMIKQSNIAFVICCVRDLKSQWLPWHIISNFIHIFHGQENTFFVVKIPSDKVFFKLENCILWVSSLALFFRLLFFLYFLCFHGLICKTIWSNFWHYLCLDIDNLGTMALMIPH